MEVRVRRRGIRYDIDDDGAAVAAAGHPPGWLTTARRVAAEHELNVNRRGVVFVQGFEGRDVAALERRVAETSAALYDALLDQGDGPAGGRGRRGRPT